LRAASVSWARVYRRSAAPTSGAHAPLATGRQMGHGPGQGRRKRAEAVQYPLRRVRFTRWRSMMRGVLGPLRCGVLLAAHELGWLLLTGIFACRDLDAPAALLLGLLGNADG